MFFIYNGKISREVERGKIGTNKTYEIILYLLVIKMGQKIQKQEENQETYIWYVSDK